MATDQRKTWTGLGLATGTTVTLGNVNTAGNGDAVVWQAPTGSPVLTTRQLGGLQGNGIELDSTVTTEVSRIDLCAGSGTADATQDAPCINFMCIYKPVANPATADFNFILTRSAAATAGYIYHAVTTATAFGIQFRGNSNANLTSALTSSPTFSAATNRTPALVTGDVYQIDFAVHQGASGTTGRIQGRVKSLSNPGTWNGGAEYYFDTGYTIATATDAMRYHRFLKPVAGNTIVDAQFTNIWWGTKNSPVSSLDKSLATANFWTPGNPTIDDGDTGAFYILEGVGTAANGGALSFSIAQTAGTTTTPTVKATTSTSKTWIITQSSTEVLEYDITVVEAGGGSATLHVIVPIAAQPSKKFQRKVWSGSAWV